MTLSELRALADGVQRIPCDDPHACGPEILDYNDSVARFRELVVLVRNRLVASGEGSEPSGAAEVRALASKLGSQGELTKLDWTLAAEPSEPGSGRRQ